MIVFCLVVLASFCVHPVFAENDSSWAPFQSLSGKCSIQFPEMPQHIVNKMQIPDSEDSIYYHIYLSSPTDGNGVYLMVVAKYPAPIDKSQELLCLEGFLSGILQKNPENELVSADMNQIQGHQAVDFFIRSSDKYFKGRSVVAKDTLYLLAVENAPEKFEDENLEKFLSSFILN